MSPRSLWKIILKCMGLWMIIGSVNSVLQYIFLFYRAFLPSVSESILSTVIQLIIILIVYSIIWWFFISKPEILIDKLKLDKGFKEETLSFRIHRSSILKIIVVIIGGMMIIDNLPVLIRQVYTFTEMNKSFYKMETPDKSFIVMYLIKLIMGILLIVYNRHIVNLIELKRRD